MRMKIIIVVLGAVVLTDGAVLVGKSSAADAPVPGYN